MKNTGKQIYLFLLLSIISGKIMLANNISVSNVTLTGQDTANDYTMVKFDISWDNSWHTSGTPSNWDAAWVFVKYRIKTQPTWHHATLNWVNGTGAADGHIAPANCAISSSNDNGSGGAYGVFIYHDTIMPQGSVNYTGVQLRWNYGVDGLVDGDSVEVCVFAIEMVYVPQGSFQLGSGGNENGHFYTAPTTSSTYTVTSEAAITVGNSSGNLYYGTGTYVGDHAGPIPAAFPKGYKAFYCMKYEITHSQYVEFLNKLTPTQDAARFYNSTSSRHSITGTTGSRSTSNPYVACNFLSWADVAAYLDWAALRPMTELEYEKACRGPVAQEPNECAWGSTLITAATGISNPGAPNETASNAGANCISGNAGTSGPLRVGCLGQGVNTRVATGASYYGIFELSGNIWERTITVGNAAGRSYTGLHGDGELDPSGNANVTNWPGTNASGAGIRGGSWYDSNVYLSVSDRTYAAQTYSGRTYQRGGRGVRTAP